MIFDDLFTDKLNKTVIGGKLDDSLVEGLENIETVDDSSATVDTKESHDVNLEIESIISKLNESQSGLEMNRYETATFLQSVNNDECVLLVKDADLDRVVEAHVLNQEQVVDPEQHSELIHEALILGGLDHPGIPPIYDLNISSNQWVYCTLKHIDGFPLSLLCVKHEEVIDERITIHDTVTDIVRNFIKIAEILQYAHNANIIHRNIKPDNFIIDDHGQVYVTAWGNAFDTEHDAPDFHILRGTPLYMSPEQAACTEVDHRTDIYGFGASLFHVLFKRPHMMRGDFDDFLDARKEAVIDNALEFEQHKSTAQLLAICKRCLASVEDRYQTMEELLSDLKAYQKSQDRLGSKQKTASNSLYWIVIILLVVVGAAWFAYHNYAQRHAGWGNPIYTETFENDEQWNSKWAHVQGSFELPTDDKRVVTKDGGTAYFWFYKQRLHGGAAIEFEAEMLPGSNPGDLSVVYAKDPDDKIAEGKHPGRRIYYLQHGAVGNVCSMIEGPRGRLDYTNQSLENGVRYKIRGEVEGKQLKLYLDGELLCSYELLFPVSSGYIGIYAYWGGKAFDNIKIYNRELPEVANVVKMGDLLLEHKVYKPALEHYQRIVRQHAGTDLGKEGTYKSGLCYYHMEEVDKAFEIWKPLEQSEYFSQINFFRWKELERVSDYHTLLRQMYAFYRSADDKLRVRIREQWGIFLYQVRVKGWKELTREFLRFRDKSFPDDQIFSGETYKALELLDIPDKALELFPDQPKYVISALSQMGEYQKIIDNYPGTRSALAQSLLASGQAQRVIDEFSDITGVYFSALMELDLIDRAEKEFADNRTYYQKVLMAKGEYDKVIELYPETRVSAAAAMLRDGNGQHFVDYTPDDAKRSYDGYDAITSLHLDRYMNNEHTVTTEMYEKAESVNYFECVQPGIRFHRLLLPDILSHFKGNPDALQRTLRKIWDERKRINHMRHWHNIGLLLGELDKKAYMAQPHKLSIDSEYYFYAALHNDLKNNKDAALKLYRAYKSLPLHKRAHSKLLLYKKFVDFRIAELSK